MNHQQLEYAKTPAGRLKNGHVNRQLSTLGHRVHRRIGLGKTRRASVRLQTKTALCGQRLHTPCRGAKA